MSFVKVKNNCLKISLKDFDLKICIGKKGENKISDL